MRYDCDFLPLLADEGWPEDGCDICGYRLRGSSYCPRCRDGVGEAEPTDKPKVESGWFGAGWAPEGDVRYALFSVGPFDTEAEAVAAIQANGLGSCEEFQAKAYYVEPR